MPSKMRVAAPSRRLCRQWQSIRDEELLAIATSPRQNVFVHFRHKIFSGSALSPARTTCAYGSPDLAGSLLLNFFSLLLLPFFFCC